jgi:hypothetical protein
LLSSGNTHDRITDLKPKEFIMKRTILILGLVSVISGSAAFAATTVSKPQPAPAAVTTPVACGTMATKVAAVLKTTKLKGVKLISATRHNTAGLALCKAKKDAAADRQFSIALKSLGA